METTSTLSRTVMRRVRIIHAVRPFFSAPALASLVFVVALWGIGREVWVAHVVQNFLAALSTGHVATYLYAAFVNTRFIVQVLVILAAGAFVYALREFARAFSPAQQYA